jgi:hypothetical protein
MCSGFHCQNRKFSITVATSQHGYAKFRDASMKETLRKMLPHTDGSNEIWTKVWRWIDIRTLTSA